MKRLGRLTRRHKYTIEGQVHSPFPGFDSPRDDIVGGVIGVESTAQKVSEEVGDLASDVLNKELPNDAEWRLDQYLDQLHVSEGCPHNKER